MFYIVDVHLYVFKMYMFASIHRLPLYRSVRGWLSVYSVEKPNHVSLRG